MAADTPDTLLDSGSVFDQSKAQLGSWLRDNANSAIVLSRDALSKYSEHSFVSGWQIEIAHRSDMLEFDILLDAQFPYSPLRVALKSKDVYLKWPHVELGGLLCLPSAGSDVATAADIGRTAISAAVELIEQCQSRDFVDEEFRREFVSYWNRLKDTAAEPIRSLLDTRNQETRKIAVWHGKVFTLVGDTQAQVEAWLDKFGRKERSKIDSGLFAYLAEAPSPPFPGKPNDLFALLDRHCPDASAQLKGFSVDQDIPLVLGAGSPSGDGLVGIDLLRVSNTNGFRKGSNLSVENKKMLWLARGRLRRRKVERFDAAWVHGRGLDKEQPVLAAAHVVLLGCGSLGSQVAIRLAQLGVGNLTLVDPQLLDAANVGRHALGIDAVGQAKASHVASEIRGRFPHIGTIAAVNSSWQDAYVKEPRIFGTASLIVACLGEWSADGQLGEWQARFRPAAAIVYGWLDELGTAAHGVALGPSGPALDFILSGDGLRHPETLWNDEVRMQSEPACGTLFHPFGPIDVVKAEALVSRLCVDILTGAVKPPVHRVYAGPTDQLIAAGGEWSAEHLKYRPPGYSGPFEYERPIKASDSCKGRHD